MTSVAIGVEAAPLRYGGFWRRWVAFMVDRFLLGLVVAPCVLVIFAPMIHLDRVMEDPDGLIPALAPMLGLILLMVPVIFAVLWLYYAWLHSSSRQATLGQMLMGLKVTDLEGRRITFAKASARYFAHIVTNLTLGLGYVCAAFTRRKQALHDLIVGTLVVRS
jgi:uncharacterized RDD family membrane protein YckC